MLQELALCVQQSRYIFTLFTHNGYQGIDRYRVALFNPNV